LIASVLPAVDRIVRIDERFAGVRDPMAAILTLRTIRGDQEKTKQLTDSLTPHIFGKY